MVFNLDMIKTPPENLDGAKVIEWAWSGAHPFGTVRYENGKIHSKIYGLAICMYPNSSSVYRFSCDYNWEVIQDNNYSCLEDAKETLPKQYCKVEVVWHNMIK